jgi:hypothetical protein
MKEGIDTRNIFITQLLDFIEGEVLETNTKTGF